MGPLGTERTERHSSVSPRCSGFGLAGTSCKEKGAPSGPERAKSVLTLLILDPGHGYPPSASPLSSQVTLRRVRLHY